VFLKASSHKVDLLNLATELDNVSRACKAMGFSRDTFYRYQSAVESGGVDALINANRKKPNLKNRVDEATESAVVAFCLEQSAFGQVRLSNELRKRGIFISPSGVRSLWLRRDLELFKKRLAALVRHVAETGEVLTEAQVIALERKQEDDVAYGEIETAHLATSVARTPSTSARSKTWAASTNRRTSTPTRSGLPQNSTTPRLRSRPPIY